MKIEVQDTHRHFDEQTRAYAEYRMFSALAAHGNAVDAVDVELTRAGGRGSAETGEPFACRVAIRLRSGSAVEVTARAAHPYEAIERAARRITTGARTMFGVVETTAARTG
jgi:ribosome-associated translation inhibitor RaiA